MTQETLNTTSQGRSLQGVVISDKMDKSITVQVERKVQHPLYKKYIRRSTKFHAHDENNDCRQGDMVVIEQCKPISKTKNWRLVEVVQRAV
jgi:small subunit ribosomal protein S17